jgi:DNA-binding MarR family transcriptional regulator
VLRTGRLFSHLISTRRQGRLSVTAADYDYGHTVPATPAFSAADAAIRRVGLTCRTAVEGRRAARALAEWARRFTLSEPEFQVLWCLRGEAVEGLDQKALATRLACSPAQVSSTVEQLRARDWIAQRHRPNDRRRHVWQLSAEGTALLAEMLVAVGYLRAVEPAQQEAA